MHPQRVSSSRPHGRSLCVAAIVAALVVAGCGSGNKKDAGTTSTGASATSTPATSTSTTPSSSQTVAQSWSQPNGDLGNTRRVSGPIDSSSVSKLGVAWTAPIKAAGTFGGYAATPVVVDGVVYTQDLSSNVYAIDLQSGKVLWTKMYNSPDVGPNGVNVSDGKVYGGTETSAFALSAKTGEQLWIKKLVRNKNEGIDMAPGINNGTVYISTVPGNGSAFYAGNGQAILWAMDAQTGATKWKWKEVPDDIWGNKKINSGGGQWNPPAFDSDGNLYLGVSNPAPFAGTDKYPFGKSRPGANLYSDSVVKLDAKTGKVLWHNQAIPHDVYDWDMENAPVLAQANGSDIVVDGGKMGVVYAYDRGTGKLLWKTPVGKHNGHDNDNVLAMKGEYSKLPKMPYTVFPGELGGVESQLAVDDTTVYAAVNDLGTKYVSQSRTILSGFDKGTGELVALDLATGKIKWQHKFDHSPYGAASVVNDLVFTTTFDGKIYALNTRTGDVAWQAKLPAGSNAPVAINGDTVITAAGYPQSKGQKAAIVAYRIGATGSTSTTPQSGGGGKSGGGKSGGGKSGGGKASSAAGKAVFGQNCASCHTLAAAGASGSVGPDLDKLKPSQSQVAQQVTNGGGGMPAFGGRLSKTQIQSVATYVASVAGKGGKGGGGGGGAP